MSSTAAPGTWRRAFGALLDVLYPQSCVACRGDLGEAEAPLCAGCRKALPRLGADLCPRCAEEIGPYATGRAACPSCSHREGIIFRGAAAVCRYEGGARELVHALKFRGDLRGADWMAQEMATAAGRAKWFVKVDCVAPVPLHWLRRMTRRFNQSDLLGSALARAHGKPYLPSLLVRTRRTPAQSRISVREREDNVRGAFRVRDFGAVQGRTVLLVDDVMTTCATAAECARTLMRARAKAVYVTVFARRTANQKRA